MHGESFDLTETKLRTDMQKWGNDVLTLIC